MFLLQKNNMLVLLAYKIDNESEDAKVSKADRTNPMNDVIENDM